jgi:DNA-binding MarR family transcriptional regulator
MDGIKQVFFDIIIIMHYYFVGTTTVRPITEHIYMKNTQVTKNERKLRKKELIRKYL